MKNKIIFVAIILTALVIMETIGWYAYKQSQREKTDPVVLEENLIENSVSSQEKGEENIVQTKGNPQEAVASENEAVGEISDFPKVTTEVVNGQTERTIHMGVRNWVWEPSTLKVKKGELVRLVIHNASDVNHPLYIPELGIEADVPPEGAVVEFEVEKRGSFFFLCGTYCGEGHMEMSGQLIVE